MVIWQQYQRRDSVYKWFVDTIKHCILKYHEILHKFVKLVGICIMVYYLATTQNDMIAVEKFFDILSKNFWSKCHHKNISTYVKKVDRIMQKFENTAL